MTQAQYYEKYWGSNQFKNGACWRGQALRKRVGVDKTATAVGQSWRDTKWVREILDKHGALGEENRMAGGVAELEGLLDGAPAHCKTFMQKQKHARKRLAGADDSDEAKARRAAASKAGSTKKKLRA